MGWRGRAGHARGLVDAGTSASTASRRPSRPPRSATATRIEVREEGPRWVGRAAYKLVGALETFGPRRAHVDGQALPRRRRLDRRLHPGAARTTAPRTSIALDVGHGQLVPELAAGPAGRPTGRAPPCAASPPPTSGEPVDLVVADLSFISLTLVLDTFRGAACSTRVTPVVLVKPQFEVGRSRLGKGGVVRAHGDRAWARHRGGPAAVRGRAAPAGVRHQPDRGQRAATPSTCCG